MARMSTRFITARVDKATLASQRILTEDAEREYKSELSEVATWWSDRIRRSGRGGSHNAQMSRIESRITSTRSGRFNMRLGWLGAAPQAADGLTTWFVYQDVGYHLFGRSTFIPGLMLQIDARQRLIEGLRDANERLARKVEDQWRRV